MLAALLCALGLQQWRLLGLQRQVAAQASDLADSRRRLAALDAQLGAERTAREDVQRARTAAALAPRRLAQDAAFWREDERRLLLSAYADFLARTRLPPETRARLEDLLVERTEALADAADAAAREGFPPGSADWAQAAAAAVGDLDREISALLGPAEAGSVGASTSAPDGVLVLAPVFALQETAVMDPAYGPVNPSVPTVVVEDGADGFATGFSGGGFSRRERARDGQLSAPRYFAVPREAGDPPRANPFEGLPARIRRGR